MDCFEFEFTDMDGKKMTAPGEFYCMQALIFLQFIDSEQMRMLDMGQRVSYLLYGFVFYIYK